MNQKVSEYIAKQKLPQRKICEKLRKIFFKNFPNIHEEMKVGVPYYDGRFYMVALKDHVNFGFEIRNFSKEELKEFQGSGKTVKVIEIKAIEEISESQIIKVLKKVLV